MTASTKSVNAMTIRFNDNYTHELARAAAEIQGQSLTAFILSAIRVHGENVLRERKSALREFGPVVLPPHDYAALMESVENPPKPSAGAIAAMRKFKKSGIKWQE
jgi:uncharacterized protein (DUF1778 family)